MNEVFEIVMIFYLLMFSKISAQSFIKSDICDDVSRNSYIENELTALRELLIEEIKDIRSDLLSIPANQGPSSVPCPSEWVPFQSSCYFFGNDYGNWKHGKVQCERKHGSSKYVSISSEREDTFIRNFVRSKGITALAARDYWIGGTDAARDGVFMWEGYSREFTYKNWGPGNPDRVGSADCVILYQPSDYKWHDTSCSNNNSYICEIEF
ncbi:perlucin-like protein [Ostrea edulis]|uniref:perlucin-like protein n=1 Tax=Ostrea edulis TaxID=37623 RepID=UPI0024AFF0A1|nr:perlucin-like protein [Ostrea edulis]